MSSRRFTGRCSRPELPCTRLSRVTGFEAGEGSRSPTSSRLPPTRLACKSLVIVGAAAFASDSLYTRASAPRPQGIGGESNPSPGSATALAPGAIVHAVYSGHRYARELDADPAILSYRRDAPLGQAAQYG